MLCDMSMKVSSCPALILLAALSAVTTACASDSDRYPSLSLRDFERVQGEFTVAEGSSASLRPEPLGIEKVSQVSESLAKANARHEAFIEQVEAARPTVIAAAGSTPEDSRWSLALVEIAELDTRRGATASLLADLDLLYADASLEFQERIAIAQARADIDALVQVERKAIDELLSVLSGGAGPAT